MTPPGARVFRENARNVAEVSGSCQAFPGPAPFNPVCIFTPFPAVNEGKKGKNKKPGRLLPGVQTYVCRPSEICRVPLHYMLSRVPRTAATLIPKIPGKPASSTPRCRSSIPNRLHLCPILPTPCICGGADPSRSPGNTLSTSPVVRNRIKYSLLSSPENCRHSSGTNTS